MFKSFKKKDKRDGKGRRDKREKKDRFWRKRVCRFCEDEKIPIDYKDGRALHAFINERGKIMPRRVTATCAYHQRQVVTAVKRARQLALLPYTATQTRW